MEPHQPGDLAPGTLLGRYRILGVIGRGGMGVVYHGHDPSLDRDVAIKVLNSESEQERDTVSGILRTEARLAAQLQHPGIVTIHELLDLPAAAGIVMELVRGQTLERVLRQPMEAHRAVGVAARAADALGFAHARGIVHCDIKPSNIMLADHGGVKVLDFGLAGLSPTLSSVSGDSWTGTLPYMSPERFKGGAVTPASDVFALAAVLYEMLSGERAFSGGDPSAVAAAVLNDSPRWLTVPTRRIPGELQGVLRRALDKKPTRRFADAGEFRAALLGAWNSAQPSHGSLRSHPSPWRGPRGRARLLPLGLKARAHVGRLYALRGPQRRAVLLAAALLGSLVILGSALTYAAWSPGTLRGARASAGGGLPGAPSPSASGTSVTGGSLDLLALHQATSGYLPPGGIRSYRLRPQVTDPLTVVVESEDFDTFLRVYQDLQGYRTLLRENDDWQGSTRASVVFLESGSASRNLIVEVSSYDGSGQGRYQVVATTGGLDFTQVLQEELAQLASLQEVYYADWYRYTDRFDELGYAPSHGVTVVIPEAGVDGWYAVARHALDGVGRGCAIIYGSVSSSVFTPGGRPVREGGHVVCD